MSLLRSHVSLIHTPKDRLMCPYLRPGVLVLVSLGPRKPAIIVFVNFLACSLLRREITLVY